MSSDNVCFMFKPTHSCNLACTYCFAETMRDKGKQIMSLQEAYTIFDWIAQYCCQCGKRTVEIMWHGGEPLLSGATFMNDCCEYYTELFSRKGIEASSRIQTNLLLVNNDFASLFKRYFNSQVGFSYDYHSNTRLFPNGLNAEKMIWDKALWCKENGLSVGAICQITPENLHDIKGLYKQFKDAEIPFKINRIFPLIYMDNPSSKYINDEQYIQALCELFDLWFYDDFPTIEIEILFNYVRMLLTGDSIYCAFKENCGESFYAVGAKGIITPCDRYDDADDGIGDVYSNTPLEIYNKRQQYTLINLDNSNCNNCEYYPICHGGCYYNHRTGWWKNECNVNRAVWKYIETSLAKFGLKKYMFRGYTEKQLREMFNKNAS